MDIENQRIKFGGFSWSSAFFGWLVATSIGSLLTGAIAAVGGRLVITNAANLATVGITSAVLLLIALAIAYYGGGYVAGRMSRFDGGRQGFGVWVMGIIVTIIFGLAGALLGSSYNLLSKLNLPHVVVSSSSFTWGGIITLIIGLAVTLVAAVAGAKAGENYHRRVDEAGMAPAASGGGPARSAKTAMESPRPRKPEPSFGETIDPNRRDRQ